MILLLFIGAPRFALEAGHVEEANHSPAVGSGVASASNAWANERVIAGNTFDFRHDSIVVDKDDIPHIFYGRDHLYHAYLDGSDWHVETIDPAWGVGSSASAAVDQNDHFHISYLDDVNKRLKYAYYDGDNWVTSEIVKKEDLASVAIAVDNMRKPHVAYNTSYNVNYAKLSGDTWEVSAVETLGEARRYYSNGPVSIAIGDPNAPNISYAAYRFEGTGIVSEIRVAQLNGEMWNKRDIVTIPRSTNTILTLDSSIAVDSQNRPHIAYDSCWQGCLEYSYWDGSSWVTQEIDAKGTQPSLSLDQMDNPYVSYRGGWGADDITYVATRKDSPWTKETISENRYATAISVESSGNRHLAMFDDNRGELLYSSSESNWAKPILIDASFDAGWSTSLVLSPDMSNQPHISYGSSLGIQYTTFVDGEWKTELIDDDVSAYSMGSSIALDPAAKQEPCVAYITVGLVKGTRYACRDDGTWSVDTIDPLTTGWNGHQISLAFDPNSPYTAHAAYAVNSDDIKEIRHAYLSDGGWITETIDFDNSGGFGAKIDKPSIAVDQAGHLHVAYARDSTDDLMYAVDDGSGWKKTSLGKSSWNTGVSLQLGPEDRPHVLWGAYEALSLLSYDKGIWSQESVDEINDALYVEVSLEFDANGQAHLSYYRGDTGQLYYGLVNDDGSQVQLVDDLGDVGRYSSIAVDDHNFPKITHYDASNGDLKFSWFGKAKSIPSSGGTLHAYNSATFEFPPGAFSDTVVITATITQPFGELPHVGVFYDIEAVYEGSGLPAQIQPGTPYTVTITYDEAAVPENVNEADLSLFYWSGKNWIREASSKVDVENNILWARPNHLSTWAGLIVEANRVNLPIMVMD